MLPSQSVRPHRWTISQTHVCISEFERKNKRKKNPQLSAACIVFATAEKKCQSVCEMLIFMGLCKII